MTQGHVPTGLTFGEALPYLLAGEEIAREGWTLPGKCWKYQPERTDDTGRELVATIVQRYTEGTWGPPEFSVRSLLASDWYLGRSRLTPKAPAVQQPRPATSEEVARALDDSLPYPVELHEEVLLTVAEELARRLETRVLPGHELWQPEEPPAPGPEPLHA
ncbi:hypothetical protein ACIRPQ_29080 [Streptomyces sp. NPDC101213]|uniref:Thoeris anti-defense Tad2 family protein n=1 Tax=Streptomyces sp. NPDC101213 TaxID=3366130 RepID=UPI0038003BF7